MSVLAQRLAALRREAGSRSVSAMAVARDARTGSSATIDARDDRANDRAFPADEPASEPPGNSGAGTNARIAALRRMLGMREQRMLGIAPDVVPDRDLPGEEIAPGLRLQEHRLAWPSLPAEKLDLSMFGRGEAIASRLRFFDTETTGLAGGTGTRAFQIGVGDWHDGVFRVRQLTITTLAAETAMLDTFARWLDDEDVLVSYNGRSYDAPLLATRYRLARRNSPLPALTHLDLLHPVRRRYRGRWANCRLSTIERELLGIVREDDLPGSEAPRAWLDYLRGGSARNLRRVGEHNRQDLCSLAGVLLRLIEAHRAGDAAWSERSTSALGDSPALAHSAAG